MLPGEAEVSTWLDTLPKSHNVHQLYSNIMDALSSHDPSRIKLARTVDVARMLYEVREAMEQSEQEALAQGIQKPLRELHDALYINTMERGAQRDTQALLQRVSLARFLLTACREHLIASKTYTDDRALKDYYYRQ